MGAMPLPLTAPATNNAVRTHPRFRSARLRRPEASSTAFCRSRLHLFEQQQQRQQQRQQQQQQQRQRQLRPPLRPMVLPASAARVAAMPAATHAAPAVGRIGIGSRRKGTPTPHTPRAHSRLVSHASSSSSAATAASAAPEGQEQDLKGKTVMIVGLGKSGRAAASLARARGADVIGVDRNLECKPLEDEAEGEAEGGDTDDAMGRVLRTELGPHEDATFAAADIIVLSPGVPLQQPQVAAALAGAFGPGVTVVSELAFAAQCLPVALPIAGVTVGRRRSTPGFRS